MKKIFSIALIAGLAILAVSCKEKEKPQPPVPISVQLQFEEAAFTVEGITVTLTDAAGTAFEAATDASGAAGFTVPIGSYSASAVYKITEDGERIAYNGTNADILVTPETVEPFVVSLLKVVSQQLIIKEVYNAGCVSADEAGAYMSDVYFEIYNNSPEEADASNLVIGVCYPIEGHSGNAYYGADGKLSFENEGWIPAGSGLWWFSEASVKIPPYTEAVIVPFSAIDHTEINPNSVNLSKPEYYWMDNSNIPNFSRAKKYTAADTIRKDHYMTGVSWAMGPSGWTLSSASPALFIGRMTREDATALGTNTEAIDATLGPAMMLGCVKFPVANVIDAVDIWSASNIENSLLRYPASINTGYVALTPQLGYSVYRNVDKEATEALEENAGKLVYNYALGTEDVEGTTDPSGIDAEASMKNGAHIIFSDTNDSSKDFHQRKQASLKK